MTGELAIGRVRLSTSTTVHCLLGFVFGFALGLIPLMRAGFSTPISQPVHRAGFRTSAERH